jgi:protocatechuate 3,4-dioxygenase alpha subunit
VHPEDTQNKPIETGFQGYGRIPTDENGKFSFATIKPGPVPGPEGKPQAPHIVVSVFMRGLLRRLFTRIYFPDDPANVGDFVLNLVEPARRGTLIAKKVASHSAALEWNVILQGPEETVFFDCGL